MELLTHSPPRQVPWNKGKLTGQKPPLKPKEIWLIRIRLQMADRVRDLAMFNMVCGIVRSVCHIRLSSNALASSTLISFWVAQGNATSHFTLQGRSPSRY